MSKRIAICGGHGQIGYHLATRLAREGNRVIVIDRQPFPYGPPGDWSFIQVDLRNQPLTNAVFEGHFDEVYQLAAEVGGLGYIMDETNDADCLHNSMQINLNVLRACQANNVGRIFFASSACVYPSLCGIDRGDVAQAQACREEDAYPANPDNAYAWEKLFGERLYDAHRRNHGMTVSIGRLHNCYAPFGSWTGGREKAPAAICRKVAEARDGSTVRVWGDGAQTRSFTYADDTVEGIIRLTRSGYPHPVNIGSAEMVTIDDMTRMVIQISGKRLGISHVDGPVGVHGRNSDNTLIGQVLGWEPTIPLWDGLQKLYPWVAEQVEKQRDEKQRDEIPF